MAKSSIKLNYVYNVIYQIINMIVPLATTPYISRVLGVDNIGIYSFTNSIVSYFILIATFGFHIYGQRQVAYNQSDKHSYSKVFFEVMLKKIFFTIISLTCYLCFLKIYGKYVEFFTLYIISIISVMFDISWFFQGLENFKITVIRNLIVKMLGVFLIFALVKSKSDLNIYIFCQCITVLLGNLTLWIYLPKKIDKIKFKELEIKKNNKIIIELFIPIVAVNIYSLIDKTMLGLTNNKTENGLYEQSQKIIRMIETILTSLGTVLIPRMAFSYKNQDIKALKNTLNKAISFIIFLGFPLFLGIIAIADNFVPWFFGREYSKVATLLKVSSPIVVIVGLGNIAGNGILLPTNQQNKATISTIIGAMFNIVFNMILIKRFFSIGAMISSLIAELSVSGIQIYFIREYIDCKSLLQHIVKSFILAMFMYLCIVNLDNILCISGIALTIIQIVTGGIIYVVSFIILSIIKKKK